MISGKNVALSFSILFVSLVFSDSSARADVEVAHEWAKRLGSTNSDYSVATAFSDRVVVSGHVTGNADLNGDGDSTDGGAESGSGYGGNDAFVSVFDVAGSFQWAKRLGSSGFDASENAFIDEISKNIIVVGVVTGNADLNGDGDSTDGGAESGSGYGGNDAFVSVFDQYGNYVWSRRLGGLGTDQGVTVISDSMQRVIITGYIGGNADINGDGDSTDGGAEGGSGYGGNDAFVSVFDVAGAFQWAKRLGGVSSDIAYSHAGSSSDHIVVVGRIMGNADLNGDGDSTDGGAESGSGYGGEDAFVSVFSETGLHQWAKRLGSTGVDWGMGVAIDSHDRVAVTGYVNGNADLNGDGDSTDGGAESVGSFGSYDSFLSVFDNSGNYRWSKRLGATSGSVARSVTFTNRNDIVVAGNLGGNADLNGDDDSTDGGAESSAGYGSYDVFATAFDSSGVHRWAKRLGGGDWDSGYSITFLSPNRIVIGGTVGGNADLNGDGDSTDGGAESGSGYGLSDNFVSLFRISEYEKEEIFVNLDVNATISLACDPSVAMNSIVGTGQSPIDLANRALCTISTNDSDGYKLEWAASTAAMMSASGDSLGAYTPTVPDTPETWSVAPTDSEWGAKLGASSSIYDSSTWGSEDTYSGGKWLNMATIARQISQRPTETDMTGDSEYVYFGVEVGPAKIQPAGFYAVDVIFTATTL